MAAFDDRDAQRAEPRPAEARYRRRLVLLLLVPLVGIAGVAGVRELSDTDSDELAALARDPLAHFVPNDATLESERRVAAMISRTFRLTDEQAASALSDAAAAANGTGWRIKSETYEVCDLLEPTTCTAQVLSDPDRWKAVKSSAGSNEPFATLDVSIEPVRDGASGAVVEGKRLRIVLEHT